MKKILTYGTFDLLHYGHIELIKRAKDMGNYLIVGLSTDDFNKCKGKESYFDYEKRKYMLESIKYVDKIVPEISWEQKVKDIIDNDIDIFVMGDDWEGKFDYLKEYCDVVYLPRTKGISTTLIKDELSQTKI